MLTATSSSEKTKAKMAPAAMPVRASGNVTVQNAFAGLAPSDCATSVSDGRMPPSAARTVRIA